MKFDVHISDRALETMLLAAIESFALGDDHNVPTKRLGSQAVEIVGPIWGSSSPRAEGAVIRVETAAISLASERYYKHCLMTDESLKLHTSVMGFLAPNLQLMGDFHSHPWRKGPRQVTKEGYEFTDEDIEAFLDEPLFWESSGGHPVMLVVTVCGLSHAQRRPPAQLRSDVWSFDIRKYRCWLTAIVGFGHGEHSRGGDDQVTIHLDERGRWAE